MLPCDGHEYCVSEKWLTSNALLLGGMLIKKDHYFIHLTMVYLVYHVMDVW